MTTPYDLLDRGFYLFPVRDKRPLVQWREESSNDPEKIEFWEKLPGRTGWGVDCGKSGLAIIDVDSGKKIEAQPALEKLEAENGTIPDTFTVRTISGGLHYYTKGTIKNSAGTLGTGIDTRGPGGYVVAPGSPGYEIIRDIDPVPTPAWISGRVGKPKPKSEVPIPVGIHIDSEISVQLAREYLQDAPPAIEGLGGDATTYLTACRVRDYGLSPAKTLEVMLDEWNDTCFPPWTPEELERKVANAFAYASQPIGNSNPENVFTPWVETANPPRFRLMTSRDVDLYCKPTSWVVQRLIPAQGCGQMFGPSGTAKTFLTMEMLAAIAEGRDFFGLKTTLTPTCLLVLEGKGGLLARKLAWEIHHGRRLPDNFFMMTDDWFITHGRDVKELAALLPKGTITVIDTQAQAAPGINESSFEDISKMLQAQKTLASLTEGFVKLITHTGKDITRGVRGHSAQLAAMDVVIETSRVGLTDLRHWKAVKVKDGRDGFEEPYGLLTVKLGYLDQYGEEAESCVITRDVVESLYEPSEKMPKTHAAALKALRTVSSNMGPVDINSWAEEYAMELMIGKKDTEGRSKAKESLRNLKRTLMQNGKVTRIGTGKEARYYPAELSPVITLEDEDCFK